MSLLSQSIPNEYSLMLAREFPDLFFAFGSVNPYRKDSVKRLQHLSELGVNVIKWLVRGERERERERESYLHALC